jgi:IS5 family transposase
LRGFAGLDAGESRLPDETTILRFRRLLERHDLARSLFDEVAALLADKGLLLRSGTIVDATLIAAAPSTKNRQKKRDPEMSQTKKGSQYYFGMKAHIGADADSGLVHTVVGSTAKLGDAKAFDQLLHGDEQIVLGDRGYSSKLRALDAPREDGQPLYAMPFRRKPKQDLPHDQRQANRWLASLRAKVEHPFRVLKRQFGYTKVLPRCGEEHRAAPHAVRLREPVDRSTPSDRRRIDVPAVRVSYPSRKSIRLPSLAQLPKPEPSSPHIGRRLPNGTCAEFP